MSRLIVSRVAIGSTGTASEGSESKNDVGYVFLGECVVGFESRRFIVQFKTK
jgi:nicotinamide mononucleotide (NMN) deamidase PncC